MEATQEQTPPAIEEKTGLTVQQGPTAKEMAAVEEANAARAKALADAEQARAEQNNEEPISIIGLAAQGHKQLHDAILAHRNKPKPEYIPPPRTERQMSALAEELEAGRRAQQRAEEQQRSRPVEPTDASKEGFTTPVYRPGDMVPDPMTGKMGAIDSAS